MDKETGRQRQKGRGGQERSSWNSGGTREHALNVRIVEVVTFTNVGSSIHS